MALSNPNIFSDDMKVIFGKAKTVWNFSLNCIPEE